MKKHLLVFGIIFLFFISAFAPMTTGINADNSKEQLTVEDYNFDRHLYPEYYDSYSVNEIPDNNRPYISNNDEVVQDISNSEIINYEKTPKQLEGPMDSAWPMYCHDTRHTGRSPYSTINNPHFEKWRFKIPGITYHCPPVIDIEGVIYIAKRDLYAIYPNGTQKWRFDYKGCYESAPAIDENGIIYVGTMYQFPNYLYAVYPNNGSMKWEYQTDDDISSSPVIGSDGSIYFSDWNGDIHSVYSNGTRKWKYHTGDIATSSPAIGLDGTIYCGSHDDHVYAFYPNNGTVKWKYNTKSWVHGSPTIGDDGTVYIGSDNGKLYAFYPNNGTVKWTCSVGPIGGSPALDENGIIYVGTFTQKFYAIYPNGTKKWTYNAPGRIWFGASATISADGTIYFGTTWMDGGEGAFIALKPDGTERFKYSNYGLIETSPAIGNDSTVYICSSHDGYSNLHAFGYPGPNPLPPTISGPATGKPGTPYAYTFTSIDPDDDQVSYYIDWNDGDITDWTDFQPSGEPYIESHTWGKGTYSIRAKAKDIDGYESDWGTQTVTMPRDKATNNVLLLRLLEQFPLLREVLIRLNPR